MMYPFHWCHKPLETMSIWLVDGIALSCLHHVGGHRSLKLRRRSQCQTRHRPRRVAKQEQELPYLQTHLEGSGRSKLTDALGMGGWDDCYWIILYLFPPPPAKHQRETFLNFVACGICWHLCWREDTMKCYDIVWLREIALGFADFGP